MIGLKLAWPTFDLETLQLGNILGLIYSAGARLHSQASARQTVRTFKCFNVTDGFRDLVLGGRKESNV